MFSPAVVIDQEGSTTSTKPDRFKAAVHHGESLQENVFAVKSKPEALQELQHFFAVGARAELPSLLWRFSQRRRGLGRQLNRKYCAVCACTTFLSRPSGRPTNSPFFWCTGEKRQPAQSSPADVACESQLPFSADRKNLLPLQRRQNAPVLCSWSRDLRVYRGKIRHTEPQGAGSQQELPACPRVWAEKVLPNISISNSQT